MIDCAQTVRQLWEYLDDLVGEPDRELIEDHLSRCLRCCGELEFVAELKRFLARSRHDNVPDDVLGRLRQTLEELGR
ncbi:zf-HC2 domain-containing protein [Blastococcus deserti]|uniref:Zf-HC2 domain-containing protein n=1 Tax=Blastococcus deserti TaxID=2259033 RepID=A0ABW4XEU0_9ACTN